MSFTKKFLIAIAIPVICAAALLGYAYFIEPSRLIVARYDVRNEGWDPALNGLRIVLVGDVHAGSNRVTSEKMRDIVRLVNEQDADLVFLLGDYVASVDPKRPMTQRQVWIEPDAVADGLAGMRSKYGIFAVLGNHDNWYYPDAVSRSLTRVGYKVLVDEFVPIRTENGALLRIFGFRDHMGVDTWKAFTDRAKDALAPTEGQGSVLFLEHSPDVVPFVAGRGSVTSDSRLFFAAHTHGGQVCLPVVGCPVSVSTYGQKYRRGLVKQDGLDVLVTSGVGTSILPFRFGVPPEIAVATIYSADTPN